MTSIQDTLYNSPALIAEKESLVAKERQSLDLARHQLAIAKAKSTITYSGEKNQTMILARVTEDQSVIDAEVAVIEALGRVKVAEVMLHEAENAFASARKLMNAGISVGDIATFTPSHDAD